VPVEASYHGSALIYRLLQNYPCERLVVVEQNFRRSKADRRLKDVRYEQLTTYASRFLSTRLHQLAESWLTLKADLQHFQISPLLQEFSPQAVLTIGHGFSWLAAAAFASRNRLPLHLVVHDDWPNMGAFGKSIRRRMARQFGEVYRQAASRLCVSPTMAEEYEKRYGVRGTVLYPSRSVDVPALSPIENHTGGPGGRAFTVGYAGSLDVGDYVKQLVILGRLLAKMGGRLILFGPFTSESLVAHGMCMKNIVLGGLLTSSELIRRLHRDADALFVPNSFQASADLAFPSKLTDYTATSLPLLIWGPPESAAIKWAFQESCQGATVTMNDECAMVEMLTKLKSDFAWRRQIGLVAGEAGRKCFSVERAQRILFDCLLPETPATLISG
jgi:glycosyltransferase involved in cell wall biosynthesis